MLAQEPLQVHVEVALVGDEADRAVGQAFGGPHVLHRVGQRQLDQGDQLVDLAWRGCVGLIRLVLVAHSEAVEVRGTLGHGAERLFLVGADHRQPELIDRVGHEQHVDPARTKALDLRAAAQRIGVLPADVVDRLLLLRH